MKLKQAAAQNGPSTGDDGPTKLPRSVYVAPMLKGMGDIRLVTLGSSPGATESGGGSISRKPAGT